MAQTDSDRLSHWERRGEHTSRVGGIEYAPRTRVQGLHESGVNYVEPKDNETPHLDERAYGPQALEKGKGKAFSQPPVYTRGNFESIPTQEMPAPRRSEFTPLKGMTLPFADLRRQTNVGTSAQETPRGPPPAISYESRPLSQSVIDTSGQFVSNESVPPVQANNVSMAT